MNRIIKKSLQGLLIVPALALGVSIAAPVLQPSAAYAQSGDDASCNSVTGIKNGIDCARDPDSQPPTLFGTGGIFNKVVNVLLFIVGAIAVIMLIYGGIRYVISGGDASAITAAKNTILYAIVGIIVAILAYALVNFVVTRFAA